MRVRQILLILVDNAIKFTPENGVVKVQVRVQEGNSGLLLLKVLDSGCGISPDLAERVFERLFQAADPALGGRRGLGLGLYICKELVARQGGRIWVENAPAQGAAFCVTLPVFSLPNLVGSVLRRARRVDAPITFVVVKIGSRTGWLSDEVRAEHSHGVRDLLLRCLHSDEEVLLPKIGSAGAAELFFIVALADQIGGKAIIERIRKQIDGSEYVRHAGLTFSTSYRLVDAINLSAPESVDEFVEKLAARIQELIGDEIARR
jgi:hypothetical protein